MPAILITPIGTPVPLVTQRSVDKIKYTVDCTNILDLYELISGTGAPTISSEDIVITELRSRMGNSLEFVISTINVAGPEFVEYSICVVFNTTFKNTKSIAFKARIYQ